MLFSLNLASQSNPKCQWVGSVEATYLTQGWFETIVGTLRYELERSDAESESYKLIGGNLTWSASGTYNGCTVQGGPLSFNVSVDSRDIGGLWVDKSGWYQGSANFGLLSPINENDFLVTLTCKDLTMKWPNYLSGIEIGALDLKFYLQNDLMTDSSTFGAAEVYQTWKWNLHKESASETKLIVDAKCYDREGNEMIYENWMPESAASGKEADVGNVIKFQASLIEADGTTSCAAADSITFQLKNVSHEPGVCLNYPRAEVAGKDYDLHFKQGLNSPTDVMSPDRLTLKIKEGREATATVASFDWGAFGTLEVTAYMPGGKTITGYLKGHPEITDILIPKRSPDSKIADIWKQVNGAQGLADDDDSEKEPVGDGDPGDGFTLYEEYRGFTVKGIFMNGDPKRKDLFVFSEYSDFFPGILLFQIVTGIDVHYQLSVTEFDKKNRVMNFNHSDPKLHSVDQHGLWVKPIFPKDDHGYSFTDHLGPPKNVDSVNISPGVWSATSIMEKSSMKFINQLNSTVAHELGHAVHIEHHGDGDKNRTWESQFFYNLNTQTFDVSYTEDGLELINPKWEDDTPFTKTLGRGMKIYLGLWGGQHSGFENCVMRYDCADAYSPSYGATSKTRYIVQGDERTGMSLCDKKEDNPGGVN